MTPEIYQQQKTGTSVQHYLFVRRPIIMIEGNLDSLKTAWRRPDFDDKTVLRQLQSTSGLLLAETVLITNADDNYPDLICSNLEKVVKAEVHDLIQSEITGLDIINHGKNWFLSFTVDDTVPSTEYNLIKQTMFRLGHEQDWVMPVPFVPFFRYDNLKRANRVYNEVSAIALPNVIGFGYPTAEHRYTEL